MKKSVRIRKALPGEQPGYYNKTAKFLKKAQMGMSVESQSQDPQRLNLIYQNAYSSLRESMTPDLVYNSLVTEYGLDQQTALNIVKIALNQLAQEGYADPNLIEQTQSKQEEPSAAQDQQLAEEEQQRAASDAEQEELAMSDQGYYDEEEAANNDRSHLEVEEDEQQEAFRFGGYYPEGGSAGGTGIGAGLGKLFNRSGKGASKSSSGNKGGLLNRNSNTPGGFDPNLRDATSSARGYNYGSVPEGWQWGTDSQGWESSYLKQPMSTTSTNPSREGGRFFGRRKQQKGCPPYYRQDAYGNCVPDYNDSMSQDYPSSSFGQYNILNIAPGQGNVGYAPDASIPDAPTPAPTSVPKFAKFGGYRQDGGSADEYSDYEDTTNYNSSPENSIINQYRTPGQVKLQKPFSIEDLMSITPGMQGQEAFPDLSYYLGDYRPIADSYNPMQYLPTAQSGGFLEKYTAPLTTGLDYFRRLTPMSNLSGVRKAFPIFTAVGQGMTKLPYIGKKFTPQLQTTFTQNRTELWNILNGAEPKLGTFSQTGTRTGGADGSLQADRLMLYQDDVKGIIQKIESGNSVFELQEIDPRAQFDGLVSGIYPMNAKVIGGTDDNGFKFFEIKHTFGPNERLPFGTTPAKAKEVTIKNRFYFNTDPVTGEVKVFDQVGNPLSTGAKTKYDITRPLGTSMSKIFGKYLTTDIAYPSETSTYDRSLTGYEYGFPSRGESPSGTRTFETETTFPMYHTLNAYDTQGNLISDNYDLRGVVADEFPIYTSEGKFGTPYPASMQGIYGPGLGRLREISDTPPATWDRLGFFGKTGRLLETYGTTGLNQLFRTSPKNIREQSFPVYGYRNPALGPDVIDPAKEGSYGSDIRNAINYKYRLGLKTSLIGAGLGYMGYKTWDALYNQCQCEDITANNYMPKDKFGNCPCGSDVGTIRTLDPTGIPNTEQIDLNELDVPDSMKFLIRMGEYPSAENYWRLRDTTTMPNYGKGGISKAKFVKNFVSKFQEGGDAQNQTLGKGQRTDTLTNDVANKKDIFKSKLKNNSNIALTEEIYKNAQSNPQILNMLMQNGPKENLAEDQGMQMAQYGGYSDDSVPSWYTGYKGMMAPKQYRKLFKQIKKMMPRGVDISRANLASSMYDRRYMQPPFGGTMSYPDYLNMMMLAGTPLSNATTSISDLPITKEILNDFVIKDWATNVDRNTPVYGMPGSSQTQAEAAVEQNNLKNLPFLPETQPSFIDSPLLEENLNTFDVPQIPMLEAGGFVDMDVENPLYKFIYGGNDPEYYEPYGLPMAQNGGEPGINILNQAREHRVVSDPLEFDEWVEGEKEDFATTHPGVDFDTWKSDAAAQQDYAKYEDFYNEKLHEYLDYGKSEQDPNINVNVPKINNTPQKCGPGTVWNPVYKSCIPIATINYNPRVVRGQSGLFRNLAPWNPIRGYAGSWKKQMSLPYYLSNKNLYMGQLPPNPVATYVTKKGLFGPKKWIDIYETSGSGAPIDPLRLEELMNQKNRRPERERKSRERREEGPRPVRVANWSAIKYKMNPKNWGKEKQYGGSYMQMGGGYNPFELGSGLSTGVGQNTSFYNPYTADAQFEKDLFGAPAPSSLPKQQQNPFAAITGTGTGSYAETKDTGYTTGMGQEIIPQKEPQNEYVGVENKRKNMYNVDPEAGVNVFNASARGVLGVIERMQNAKNQRNLTLDTVDPMNLYASATETDRGDWVDFGHKSGMYRYDQEGQDRSSRATFGQYGGYMQEGGASSIEEYEKSAEHQEMLRRYREKQIAGRKMQVSNASGTPTYMVFDGKGELIYTSTNKAAAEKVLKGGPTSSQNFQYGGSFEQDEEVYMTPEELEQFLAAGGQVEYL